MNTGKLTVAVVATATIFLTISAWGQEQEAQVQTESISAKALAAAMQQATAEPDAKTLNQQFLDQECSFFGADRERFTPKPAGAESNAGSLTRQFYVARKTTGIGSNTTRNAQSFGAAMLGKAGLIDTFIWADLQKNNVTPAMTTTDYEFVRRIYLDLIGRIPTQTQMLAFVTSSDPNKRQALIDSLIGSPQWVDKWTMFYGDLYQNTASNTQVSIRAEGRNAFYKFIHDSLAANKPYDQMAAAIINAKGTNSFDQTAGGPVNYFALNVVGGGPTQDIFDSQTAAIADQFLGLAHVNCLLCHNGRGHLDSLSLWAGKQTRTQAWGQAAFMAHTWTRTLQTPKDPNNGSTVSYWSLDKYTTDYNLNTTTGNRPARQPITAGTATVKTITPTYMLNGQAPMIGEDYRAALARLVTTDRQFARAAVNYIWAAFFGKGIVDPPDQFDPARLDPNNPPPAPWTLQPTNAALLEALTQWFIDNKYDVQGLQRLIVNSDTYQIESQYNGDWNPAWETLWARKFVRRMWAEELHDSVVTAINTLPSYTVNGFTNASTVYGVDSPGFGKISYAMQAPDVVNMPDNGGAVSQFLDNFLRGDRYSMPRKSEGSILQTLGLMNDNFIMSRIHATGSGATSSFLMNELALPDSQLIDDLFMKVLSRYPTADEKTQAVARLEYGGTVNRKINAEDVLWTLFNKVDFIFNY